MKFRMITIIFAVACAFTFLFSNVAQAAYASNLTINKVYTYQGAVWVMVTGQSSYILKSSASDPDNDKMLAMLLTAASNGYTVNLWTSGSTLTDVAINVQ